jgi:hypothetical protein
MGDDEEEEATPEVPEEILNVIRNIIKEAKEREENGN